MHETGHTSTHDLSLTSMHGWVMTYGTRLLTPQLQEYSTSRRDASATSGQSAEEGHAQAGGDQHDAQRGADSPPPAHVFLQGHDCPKGEHPAEVADPNG